VPRGQRLAPEVEDHVTGPLRAEDGEAVSEPVELRLRQRPSDPSRELVRERPQPRLAGLREGGGEHRVVRGEERSRHRVVGDDALHERPRGDGDDEAAILDGVGGAEGARHHAAHEASRSTPTPRGPPCSGRPRLQHYEFQ